MTVVRVLVVDDYEPFRQFICTTLENPRFRIVAQASNGLEAVRMAEELQPDLILLDISLPQLNGIEAAKRISKVAPHSKILFISQEDSSDVVQAALSLGVLGYIHKSRTHADLLPAIEAVLAGRQFVSASLKMPQAADQTSAPVRNRHEVLFYSEDATLIDRVARFIIPVLRSGNPAIVVATQAHREALSRRLKEDGLDVESAIQKGKYISKDSPALLTKVMVNGWPDHIRYVDTVTNAIKSTSEATNKRFPRIAIFAECVNLLCTEGNTNAALDLEKLCNAVLETVDNVNLLCGYQLSVPYGDERKDAYDSICKEHSAVYD
jgi:DNA-binding NarL/FixJ family response regulator